MVTESSQLKRGKKEEKEKKKRNSGLAEIELSIRRFLIHLSFAWVPSTAPIFVYSSCSLLEGRGMEWNKCPKVTFVHRAAYSYAEGTCVSVSERSVWTFIFAKVPRCICQFILQNKPLDTKPESLRVFVAYYPLDRSFQFEYIFLSFVFKFYRNSIWNSTYELSKFRIFNF